MNAFEQALERYLKPEQLERIRKTKIGIAGGGGLGSNCAHLLIRTGFRYIRIVDFDVLDYSNLNRQFYFLGQVGSAKVAELKKNLLAINPDAIIEAIEARIEAENAAGLFADCDVVVEAFDRPEYKKMIIETYLNTGKFLVAASGLAGWGDSDRIKIHRIRDNFFIVGDLKSAIGPDCPPLAPCVQIAAAKQADLVLSYVLAGKEGVQL
ncbi:MAG: sulfur carrier protein ThiS adenylyltransferase ThiF [Negativicutes bacterium]|nr:sulfur carrier protein ThiS adenylyltransferase ThiF [Negativicutes bacterium]